MIGGHGREYLYVSDRITLPPGGTQLLTHNFHDSCVAFAAAMADPASVPRIRFNQPFVNYNNQTLIINDGGKAWTGVAVLRRPHTLWTKTKRLVVGLGSYKRYVRPGYESLHANIQLAPGAEAELWHNLGTVNVGIVADAFSTSAPASASRIHQSGGGSDPLNSIKIRNDGATTWQGNVWAFAGAIGPDNPATGVSHENWPILGARYYDVNVGASPFTTPMYLGGAVSVGCRAGTTLKLDHNFSNGKRPMEYALFGFTQDPNGVEGPYVADLNPVGEVGRQTVIGVGAGGRDLRGGLAVIFRRHSILAGQ